MNQEVFSNNLSDQLESAIDALIRTFGVSIHLLNKRNATLELLLRKVRADSLKARETWSKSGLIFHQNDPKFLDVRAPKGLVC